MSAKHYTYETIPDFLAQDDLGTEPLKYDYAANNFGLIKRDYDDETASDRDLPQWKRFERYMTGLANNSSSNTQYKVIYLGRHGEGFHNVGEAKYGTKAWEEYWAKLETDGELYWSDAHLTETGIGQALMNNAVMKAQFGESKMPPPQAYYSSPMYRCLQTANLTFGGLALPKDRPFRPTIKELMREVIGRHTCDRRSSKTVIHDAVPDWRIEPGFTEKDELWQADHRETHEEHDARTQKLLDDIFTNDKNLFLSFTGHSGATASILRVIGHVEFRLQTGGMMPVLIKATEA